MNKIHEIHKMENNLMDSLSDAEPQLACPICQHTGSVSWTPKVIILAKILSLGLFPLIFPIRQTRHQCQHCYHEWNHWY